MGNNEYRDYINWNNDCTLPSMCISLWNNKMFFTTKKIGSRYFEDLSKTDGGEINGRVKSIDFRIERIRETELDDTKYDKRLVWGSHYYFVTNASYYNIDEFLNELGITKVSDILSESVLSKRQLIFVVRNPIIRTLTAFIEVVDSYYANSMNIHFIKPIIQKYFTLNENDVKHPSLHDLTEEKSIQILNEYSEFIGKFLIVDEHSSGWHQFLFRFITLNNIKSNFNIIDLDNKSTLKNYPKISQPSNKKQINVWLAQEDDIHVRKLISSMNHFLIAELDAYDSLCELYNPNDSELI